jgi:hypothetical protein
MKKHTIIQTVILTLLTFPLLWSCGDVGTDGINCAQNPNSPFCNAQFPTQYNFRITSTSPFNGTDLVSTQLNVIRVYFSEPVDETTIPGNILIYALVGDSSIDVTSNFTFVANGNGQLEIIPNDGYQLQINTVYSVQFMPNLLSTVQNPIFGGVNGEYPTGSDFTFSTGATGSNSKPGPPSIVSMSNFNPPNSCGGAIVTFDEDIAYPPQGVIKIKRLLGLIEVTVPAHVSQAVPNRFDQWILAVPTYECGSLYTQGFAEVQNAADFDGQQLTNPQGQFIQISEFL